MPAHTDFYIGNVLPLEEILLEHPIGALFTGKLFTAGEHPLETLNLPEFGNGGLSLDAESIGRLFMAPDDSIVEINLLEERPDGVPAGFHVKSDNPFVQPDDPVVVVAYQTDIGNAMHVDNLHLTRVMLEPDAPERLCTVAFGLMAVTAYKKGFKQITLFAAGNGHHAVGDPDEMVGYLVWPKFGFDAALIAVDLQENPGLARCQSVQDVIAVDPIWWQEQGSGREMTFDLAPGSRSWNILLNYIYTAIAEGA